MLYTRDSSLWLEEGPKALLDFLSTAEKEQHDAAVYDTKCEFDRHDPDAIRYIACLAMTKASDKKEEFSYELPSNGTVAPIGAPIGTEDMLHSSAYRAKCESGDKLYIPSAADYVASVIKALNERRILSQDTAEEEIEGNSDNGESLASGFLCAIGVKGVLLIAFFLIGLIGLLRACFG